MSKNAKASIYLLLAGILVVLPSQISGMFANYTSWMLLFCILPGLGVLFGGFALYLLLKHRREVKLSGQTSPRRGFAIAGLIMSVLVVLFGLLSEVFYILLAIQLKPVPNEFVGSVESYTYSEDGYSIFPFRSVLLPDGNIATLVLKSEFPKKENSSRSLQLICTNQRCEKNWDMIFEEATGRVTLDRNGNIIVCTWTRDNENAIGYYMLSPEGEILGSETFEFETAGSIIDMFETKDSNYLIVRSNKTESKNVYEFHYQKISRQGEDIWSFSHTGLSGISHGDIIQTSDNEGNESFIIAGTVAEFPETKVRVIKINQNGVMEWENLYTDSGAESGKSILETDDGNFIILGDRPGPEEGDTERSAVLLKIDPNGELIWRKKFAWTSMPIMSFVPWENGGFLIVGRYVNSPNRMTSTFEDFWDTFYMTTVSANGEIIRRFHGDETKITVNSVLSIDDENCILMGFGDRTTRGNPDIPNNMRFVSYQK
ncbi:MAG: hypothetical protein HN590_07275 [Calditrichaeota bacterium]|nr:hypothetical protein [Calditrichota bacterium]